MLRIKRKLISDLSSWVNSKDRKPLLVRGARQVGKSWAVQEWCRRESRKLITLNFEENPRLIRLFDGDLDVQRIVNEISLLFNVSLGDPASVLFFDEIQRAPQAITALRYFYERRPELPVVAAGSLVEFILEEHGVPVGRVQSKFVYPLSFTEFLGALGKESLAEEIRSFDPNVPKPFAETVHFELLDYLKLYYRLGGMPKVVSAYVEDKDLRAAALEQATLVRGYMDDFRKYAKRADWALLETIFQKMGAMAGGPSIKFTTIDSQAKSMHVRRALLALERAMIIHKIRPTRAIGLPLSAHAVDKFFKLAFLDIGLLHNIMGFDWARVSSEADLTDVADGRFAEQFVAQEIITSRSDHSPYDLHYWTRSQSGSEAEVDFVVEQGNVPIPLEVKSGSKGRLKSLHLYQKELNCSQGFVFSQRNVQTQDKITFLPLYVAGVNFK